MASHDAGGDGAQRLTTPGDSLFMLAYRCWHAGFDYGDAECWQYAWNALSVALGPNVARPLLGAVEDFVRCLRRVARRRLDYYPPPCCRMSEREHQVLQLITVLQGGAPDADALIDGLCGPLTPDASRLVVVAGRALAARLLEAGITLRTQPTTPQPRAPLRSLH